MTGARPDQCSRIPSLRNDHIIPAITAKSVEPAPSIQGVVTRVSRERVTERTTYQVFYIYQTIRTRASRGLRASYPQIDRHAETISVGNRIDPTRPIDFIIPRTRKNQIIERVP
ncbi:hypothetical protein D9M68_362160 [compost metagenome]